MPILAILLLLASVVAGFFGVSNVGDLGLAIAQIFFWGFIVAAGVILGVNSIQLPPGRRVLRH